jgi:hypothetical protein
LQFKTIISDRFMPVIATSFDGLLIFEPGILHDERGYFYESYNQRVWANAGVHCNFVQDNQARSTRGVLRGLHYQCGEMAQAKLVRVIEGEVLDVVVRSAARLQNVRTVVLATALCRKPPPDVRTQGVPLTAMWYLVKRQFSFTNAITSTPKNRKAESGSDASGTVC